MEDENIENFDSTNEADITVNLEDESVEDKVARLEEQNKKLFERAKKAEAKSKERPAEKPITNNSSVTPRDILKSDEFVLHRMGYDETEIEVIMNNGGKQILENKNSPITLGIQASREQRGAENASSMAKSSSQLSEVERKFTPDQLRNMTAEELSKILPHAD